MPYAAALHEECVNLNIVIKLLMPFCCHGDLVVSSFDYVRELGGCKDLEAFILT